LPPRRRHVHDGSGERSDGGCRSDATGPWNGQPLGRGRLDHANGDACQHELDVHHDRRARRRLRRRGELRSAVVGRRTGHEAPVTTWRWICSVRSRTCCESLATCSVRSVFCWRRVSVFCAKSSRCFASASDQILSRSAWRVCASRMSGAAYAACRLNARLRRIKGYGSKLTRSANPLKTIHTTTITVWLMRYCGVPKKRATRSAKAPNAPAPNVAPRCA